MPTSQLDRKKRDLILRRSDILRAAERAFAVRGYHQATMADIAEEAQYGVGTLYLYFKDKQSLYVNLLEKKTRQLIGLVKENVEKGKDPLERIKILIQTQLKFFISNEDFFRIFFSQREGLRWKVKDRVSASTVDLQLEFLDYIADLIAQAQSRGIITKKHQARKVAAVLSAIIHSIVMPRLMNSTKHKEDITNQYPFVLEVFLNGMGAK